MDAFEREAILMLAPTFGRSSVIVDGGSNKGDWTAILANRAGEVHLFEPNIKLLHYCEVRFAGLNNLYYHNVALDAEYHFEKDFFYFDDNHNGLSSICQSDFGNELTPKTKKVECKTLDSYEFEFIDLLKLDVEGAELQVLQGARELLQNKKIRYIQFEHGHSNISDIINLAGLYGYYLHKFTGTTFERINGAGSERQNLYLMTEYTEDWNAEFRKNTEFLKGKVQFALEIGCFEGLTSNYICDFLLKAEGRMICIDPLEDCYLVENLTPEAVQINQELSNFKGQYKRFCKNTKGQPIELKRTTSQKAFGDISRHGFQFDFIYIDGDHREKGVNADANLYWNQLRDRGYMLFDDYKWSAGTKKGIDDFIKDHKPLLKVILKNYQVMIQKWIS